VIVAEVSFSRPAAGPWQPAAEPDGCRRRWRASPSGAPCRATKRAAPAAAP